MRYVLQALDDEGYTRPLVEADTVPELVPLTLLGFACRIWDRKRQEVVTLRKEAA